MKSTAMQMLMAAALAVSCQTYAGVTATWTGAADNRWTNAANWLVGGAVPASCPGVVEADDPAAATGDIAVFDGTCASGNTTIDLSGLYSIGTVTVSGEACPQYTFGTTTDQVLAIEKGGEFTVSAEVSAAACPVVNATLAVGNFTRDTSSGGQALTVGNNSSGVLVFNSQFVAQRRRSESSPDYMEATVRLEGNGSLRFNANQVDDKNWLVTYACYQTGTLEVNADFIAFKHMNVNESFRVAIAEDAVFGSRVGNNCGYTVTGNKTLTIDGKGLFRIAEHNGKTFDNHGPLRVNNGAIEVYSRAASYSPTLPAPRVLLSSTGTADARRALRLFGESGDFPGGFLIAGAGCLSVGGTNSLGTCGAITVTNTTLASFSWEGKTENESLTVPINYIGGESSVFTLSNAGSVPFAVASSVTVPDSAKTLCLDGSTAPIVYGATVSGGNIALKMANSVVVAESASFANCSSVSLSGGAAVTFNGTSACALPTVSVVSGANVFRFANAMTLTVPSLDITGGTLDLQVEGSGATVVFTGKTSADTPPAGLLVDGYVPVFADDGTLSVPQTAIDVQIAARGATVPDASASVIGITSPGAGAADTLEEDATTVKALIQQTLSDAEVVVGAGQTLSAGELAIDYGAGDLIIGASGNGAVSGASSPLVLRNDSYTGELSVNAAISSADILKTGVGDVSLAGGMTPSVGVMAFAGGETSLGGTWNTTSSSKILVTNNAVLSVSDGARLISDAGAVHVANTVGTIDVSGGALKIEDGASITNRIMMNFSKKGTSAVYQTGGVVYEQGDTSNNLELFDHAGDSQGYWDISGGTLSVTGRLAIARNGGSQAAIRQSGGRMEASAGSTIRIGMASASAEIVMTGGTNLFSNGMNLRDWGNCPGTRATVTMDGANAEWTVAGNVQAAFENNLDITTFTCAMLNLADGVFCANNVLRGGNNGGVKNRTMSTAYVNFNGGTFKTRTNQGNATSGGLFQGTADNTYIDYVTAYAGGAVIETDAASRRVYLRVPLRAPTGKGVATVDFDAYTGKRSGLIAPPSVLIEGDGQGASAYAVFDAERGVVTGIRVVSPGWGYTTAVAKLRYGSLYNTPSECPVTLADNVSGGLTKTGPGTLVLAVANTYTGRTVLKQGALELAAPGALPDGSVVVYEGGELVSSSAAFPQSLKVYIPGAEDGSVQRVTLATFTDACPEALPEIEVVNAPSHHPWRAEFRGNSLCARMPNGLIITVR